MVVADRSPGFESHATEQSMDAFCQAWSPRVLSVLRIVTALLFLQPAQPYLGFPHVADLTPAISSLLARRAYSNWSGRAHADRTVHATCRVHPVGLHWRSPISLRTRRRASPMLTRASWPCSIVLSFCISRWPVAGHGAADAARPLASVLKRTITPKAGATRSGIIPQACQ